MLQPSNQTNGALRGRNSGNVAQWIPIESGEQIDLVRRLNWLGWVLQLITNATIQPGDRDEFFLSDANAVFQYKRPAPAAAGGTSNQGGGGVAGTGSGSGNMNFVGAWSGGGSYAVEDVVTHTKNGMLGAFVRISGTGAGVEPFTTGWAADWTMIGNRFEDSLTLYKTSTEHIVLDADAGTTVITQGSNVITLNAVSQQIKITDGTNIITLDTSADEIRITDGSTYTQVKKDLINQQNSGGTVQMVWNGATEALNMEFSDGGSVEITKLSCDGKAITLREWDVCDSGTAKFALFLSSAPYTLSA